MGDVRRQTGDAGEDAVERALIQAGYLIVGRPGARQLRDGGDFEVVRPAVGGVGRVRAVLEVSATRTADGRLTTIDRAAGLRRLVARVKDGADTLYGATPLVVGVHLDATGGVVAAGALYAEAAIAEIEAATATYLAQPPVRVAVRRPPRYALWVAGLDPVSDLLPGVELPPPAPPAAAA